MSKKKKKKIIMLIDYLNISINAGVLPLESPLITILDRIQKQIIQEVGAEIVNVFIFAPPHLTSTEMDAFYREGFYVISCPRIKTKEGKEKDTTDEILIGFLKDVVPTISGLTHICLGSGDKDFCKALRGVMRKGLKLIIAAGDLKSLSPDLIELADINPLTDKRMVYLFSQTRE